MKTIRLNRQNIHMLSGSPGGNGFTRKQVELLGFTWPPQKGWLSSLIGKEIPVELYQEVAKHYRPKWAAINDPLGKVEDNPATSLPMILFHDSDGMACVLEQSDAVFSPDSRFPAGQCALALGHPNYQMHLSRDKVRKLANHLTHWLETGSL